MREQTIKLYKLREETAKKFLDEAEEQLVELAKDYGFKLVCESDTRGKYPSLAVRVMFKVRGGNLRIRPTYMKNGERR